MSIKFFAIAVAMALVAASAQAGEAGDGNTAVPKLLQMEQGGHTLEKGSTTNGPVVLNNDVEEITGSAQHARASGDDTTNKSSSTVIRQMSGRGANGSAGEQPVSVFIGGFQEVTSAANDHGTGGDSAASQKVEIDNTRGRLLSDTPAGDDPTTAAAAESGTDPDAAADSTGVVDPWNDGTTFSHPGPGNGGVGIIQQMIPSGVSGLRTVGYNCAEATHALGSQGMRVLQRHLRVSEDGRCGSQTHSAARHWLLDLEQHRDRAGEGSSFSRAERNPVIAFACEFDAFRDKILGCVRELTLVTPIGLNRGESADVDLLLDALEQQVREIRRSRISPAR